MPTLKINDIDLYYETYGQGEPLIFISGFTCDHSMWEFVVPAFTHKYQVIIFDNRGSGQSSDKPDYPYTAQVLADDTIGLIKALDLQKVNIVGHSYGGCVTQTLALKYPEFVKSVVFSNTLLKAHPRLQLFAQTRFELMKANSAESAIVKLNALMCFSNEYLGKANRIEQLVKVGLTPMTVAGYQHQLDGLLAFDSRQWVANIKKPCLIICADEDLMVTLEEARHLEQTLTDTEYFCFKHVGHLPMFEQPELFNKVVLQFLEKH
ncbi:MAG: alpha/beta hydrolase [Pseudomonadota bacterium]